MSRKLPICSVALALLIVASANPRATAQTDPDQLLKYIPTPVNTVGVVNVAAIMRSPRAQREGWSKLSHTEYLAGAIPVHSSLNRIIFATEFIPHHPSHGGGLAIAPTTGPIDVEKLAKNQGGELTTVGDEKAVRTRGGAYLLPLGDRLLGAMRTDYKPDVTRWVRYAQTAERSQQSPYVNLAVNNFGLKHHVLIVLDTEDLLHPEQIRAVVAASEVSRLEKSIADAVIAYSTGLIGFRFTADITEKGIEATLRIDSRVKPTMPPDVMKAFVIETLARNGAELSDIAAAKATIQANSVILAFQVTDEELAKVMSVFLTPTAGLVDTDKITVTPAGVNGPASQAYYQAVIRIIDDLRGKRAKETDKGYQAMSVWYQTAANRIATLSILNVDPEVVQFADGVAGRLAKLGQSLEGVPLQAADLERQAYVYAYRPSGAFWTPWTGVRFNPWARAWGGGVDTNIGQINRRIQKLIEDDRANRDTLWKQIDEERGKIRQSMAQKYGSDFEPTRR